MEETEEDERLCRYCFDGPLEGDELIAPCNCAGGQKWVHLSCLRRWQRMVLVSQPTHPQFYKDDIRHHKCNVCNGPLSCKPPERHELMQSFTGPELAALIQPNCVIAAHEVFSEELSRQLEVLDDDTRERVGYLHWIHGVTPDTGQIDVPIRSLQELSMLRMQLAPDLSLMNHAKRLSLVPAGSLQGVPGDQLEAALSTLSTPALLCFASDEPPTMGDDHIAAINLTRPFKLSSPQVATVQRAMDHVRLKHPNLDVNVEHYIGGPCEQNQIKCCVIPGGASSGWLVVHDLERAITIAHSCASKRVEGQGDIVRGQTVVLHGLKSRPDLNGAVGIALRFQPTNGRWQVRLADGDGKELKCSNLDGQPEGLRGRVLEMTNSYAERWEGVFSTGRLAFAPVTEMTEEFMKSGVEKMEQWRAAGALPREEAEEQQLLLEGEEDPSP